MTKWKRSISPTPTTIATPRMTSASTMPQNSSLPRCCRRHRERAEDEQEDDEVVERERALDEVDGEVADAVVAARVERHRDRDEHAEDEPADAPDDALAERRLAVAREQEEVDEQQRDDDRDDDEDGRRDRRRARRAAAGLSGGRLTGTTPIYEPRVVCDRRPASGEEERDADDEVDGEQLQALEPGRLAVLGDLVGDQRREQDRAASSKPLKTSGIGPGPITKRGEDEHRARRTARPGRSSRSRC